MAAFDCVFVEDSCGRLFLPFSPFTLEVAREKYKHCCETFSEGFFKVGASRDDMQIF